MKGRSFEVADRARDRVTIAGKASRSFRVARGSGCKRWPTTR